jgi:hypothetical protein
MSRNADPVTLMITLRSSALASLMSRVVPDPIERLAQVTARRRRFVARSRDAIHPGRPDLPVIRARSGWWVSASVGGADLLRALNALARANGLVYGRGISLVR